jgi:hypothetical protein
MVKYCKKHIWAIIGHTKFNLENIRLHYQCSRCRKLKSERYKDNDPFIDEESHGKKWSGYSWWMYKELDIKMILKSICKK